VNRDFVLFNLREAAAELERTVREIEAHPAYSGGELLVAMQHAYHHLNSAWNGQDLPELKAMNPTDASWNALGEFPAGFPLMRLS
jgi:hypothetical protein